MKKHFLLFISKILFVVLTFFIVCIIVLYIVIGILQTVLKQLNDLIEDWVFPTLSKISQFIHDRLIKPYQNR